MKDGQSSTSDARTRASRDYVNVMIQSSAEEGQRVWHLVSIFHSYEFITKLLFVENDVIPSGLYNKFQLMA